MKPSLEKTASFSTYGTSDTVLNNSEPAWTLTSDQAIQTYGSHADNGLNHAECEQRLKLHGPNQLDEGKGVSALTVLIRQVCNAMIVVLLIAMAISFGIKDFIAGGVIAAVFVINVVVAFIQDYRAEKTMEALRSLASPTAHVLRNGSDETIPSQDLVPGDLVVIGVGDTVPADCRIITCMNFETDEALLTGESLPVSKESNSTFEVDSPVGDRVNMAFSSSVVTKGRAKLLVTATGMTTEIGRIAESLRGDDRMIRSVYRDEQGNARKRDYAAAFGGTLKDLTGAFLGTTVGTPLHRSLAKLAVYLFGMAVVLAIIAMAAQKFHVNKQVAVYAIALALANIPASLVIVLTVTMAVGSKTMITRNVIVRKMDSLEALGSVTDICSDKTGTLTQGKMIARKVWVPDNGTYDIQGADLPFDPTVGEVKFSEGSPADEQKHEFTELPQKNDSKLEQFLDVASLANIATVRKDLDGETGQVTWKATGDPTEIAVQVFVSRMNWQRQRWTDGDSPVFSHLAEYPFDSSIKRMSAVYQHNETGEITVFTKGAAERIIGCCSHWYKNGEKTGFDKQSQSWVQENVEAMTQLGLVCFILF